MPKYLPYIFIVLFGSIFFIHSIGSMPLFDWDEINFAESAREMIVTGNYMQVQINYEAFWEKPPLFFWMQVACMKAFGINEFSARLPNAIAGIFTLLTLFNIGKRIHNQNFAYTFLLVFCGALLPQLYFKSGIIDPWFNLFILLGLFYLSNFISENTSNNKSNKALIFSALFIGLAILTKGPVALLIVLLSYLVFIFLNKKNAFVPLKYYLIWLAVVFLVALLWFGLEIVQHGWWFMNEFITYQIRLFQTKDAGHGGFLLYHFVVLFFGCFPASIFIFNALKNQIENVFQKTFRLMMLASLIVILIVFTIVKTKILHYSSFAFFPICYLAALSLYKIIFEKNTITNWQKWILFLIGIIISLLIIALPIIGKNIYLLIPYLQKDAFALENLKAVVPWSSIESIYGILFLMALVVVYIFMKQQKIKHAMILLFVACFAIVQIIMTQFIPKIELYSQDASIEFYKSLAGKDMYIKTLGYKSYAQYFYTKYLPKANKQSKDEHWLLTQTVDKPTYFVCKNTFLKGLMAEHASRLKILYEKNGFVFLKRR